MRKAVCLIGAFALAAGLSLAADDSYLLAPRLVPGQVLAYDGSYRLQVPSSKNGKALVLASLVYGLVLKVEEVNPEGTLLSLVFDRCEWQLRGAAVAPLTRGRLFKFRLDPQGRIVEVPDLSLAWLREVWPGWPSRPLRVGESWRVENRASSPGLGVTAASREFRLCDVGARGPKVMAFLDYIERGQAGPMVVNLPGSQGRLEGAILGVGQLSMDLASGMVESAAAVSILEGTLRPAVGHGDAAKSVRLESETTLRRREKASAQ